MNPFLQSSKRLIARNGVAMKYCVVGATSYNVETGTNTASETEHNIISYPKQINASQYHFPDLIGKESCMFYLANDALLFTPKVGDFIKYKTLKFRISSIQETVAHGAIVLYRLIGVKG